MVLDEISRLQLIPVGVMILFLGLMYTEKRPQGRTRRSRTVLGAFAALLCAIAVINYATNG